MMHQQKRRVVVFGKENSFTDNLVKCLEHTNHIVSQFHCYHTCLKFLKEKNTDVLIYLLLEDRISACDELKEMVTCDPDKLILIEDAKRIYTNSKNKAPFAVYKKLIPKNDECKNNLSIEDVVAKVHNHIIFRVAEVYGPDIHHGLVYDLLHKHELIKLKNGLIDVIYQGDLIFAIEIGIECDATGVFDIASGKPIKMKKLVMCASEFRKTKPKIRWSIKKEKIIYDISNFKYFKWHPLVGPESGIKVTKKLEELNHNSKGF